MKKGFIARVNDQTTGRSAIFQIDVGPTPDTCAATFIGVTFPYEPVPAGGDITLDTSPLPPEEAARWEALRASLLKKTREQLVRVH